MSETTTTCSGCGHQFAGDYPKPDHCGHCPMRLCDGCGHLVEGAGHLAGTDTSCPCWTPVENVATADLKAALAHDGIGLGMDGELTL